jgi:hypothetical protein
MNGGGVGYVKYHKKRDLLSRLTRFLKRGSIEFVKSGTSGVALKSTTTGNSPYVSTETGERVNTILIKLVVIGDASASGKIKILGTRYQIDAMPATLFKKEVEIQHRVFNESSDICPSILFSTVLNADDLTRAFGKRVVETDSKMGLIVMEMVEDATSLNYAHTPHYDAVARAKFLYMGMKGLNHGDFHRNNALVAGGKVHVIDFGRATFIPQEDVKLIEKSVQEGDYVQGLRLLLMNAQYPKEVLDFQTHSEYLDVCHHYEWANTTRVNSAITKMVDLAAKKKCQHVPCHFLKYYKSHFGWVFSDDSLNLTDEAKAAVGEQMALLQGPRAAKSTVRHNRGSSMQSFGSSDTLSSASDGRTRRKRQRS